MQRVLQQCCKTSPVIHVMEGKDDALHKQLMGTTTSSLHEKCFGIFGKETSRDKNVVYGSWRSEQIFKARLRALPLALQI